jgi:hypothetical protein
MATRLLPFRQYDDNDVVNMYALVDAAVNENVTGVGSGDAGVFVKVSAGNFDLDPVSYGTNSYLGKTDYPFVGANQYPSVNLKVTPAASGDLTNCLGLTLRQTAKFDENGEKLLYYRQKAEELMCVLPGQAVPVATRGVFSLGSNAFGGGTLTGNNLYVGSGIKLSATQGNITGCTMSDAGKIGIILGTGTRTSQSTTDQFAGNFVVIGLRL